MNVITYVNPSELFARLAADLPDDVRDHVFVGPGAHPCPGAARDAHRHGGLASALALRAPDVLPNAMESFGQSGRRPGLGVEHDGLRAVAEQMLVDVIEPVEAAGQRDD